MFERHKPSAFLCFLFCALMTAGFVLFKSGLVPGLGPLYLDGWWTLLMTLPALTMMFEDGYSPGALGLFSGGLMLFAFCQGKLVLPLDIAKAVGATVALGAAAQLRKSYLNHQLKQLAQRHLQSLEAPEENPFLEEKKASPSGSSAQTGYSQTAARQQTTAQQQTARPQADPVYRRQNTTGWQPPAGDSARTSPKGWQPPTAAKTSAKGWQPSTAPNVQQEMEPIKPKSVRKSKKQETIPYSSESFPVSVGVFGDSQAASNCQALQGGLALALFGDAKLHLRDGDYQKPIQINALSIFGKTVVNVPYVSNLSIVPITIFGSVKDKRKLVNSSAMPTMRIVSISLFGDVVIQ